MKIALVVPPVSDLNTPYSALPRLTGWLRKLGHEVLQVDLSIEMFLRLFSREGLTRVFAAIDPNKITLEWMDVYIHRERYVRIIDDAIAFVQGRDFGFAHQVVLGNVLPEGPHFRTEPPTKLFGQFGQLGSGDLARHKIGFMLQDLTDLIGQTIAPHFALTKYGEKLAYSLHGFDTMVGELEGPRNVLEEMMLEVAAEHIPEDIELVGFTCPFPGNMLGALLVGRWMKEFRPDAIRVIGGGYPSTELRALKDPRFFDYTDYLVLDDGELPLQQICARIEGRDEGLKGVFTRENGRVVFHAGSSCEAPRFGSLPAPDYRGIALDRYIQVTYLRNHISRILSAGTWLNITAAHGCYWKKCTFCDIHLPYIGDFDPMSVTELADQMDAMHEQTGLSGFHFTDEAAPPSLLVALAIELLRRGRGYRFWGNVRYDTYFTPERCRLLAAAGMIAVTGGIEVANDEVLVKIAKGITMPHTIKVLQAFTDAGIMTHAYLIYGFPGERRQDTVNSLEVLRQLMKEKLLYSGFYHMFSLTTHAPIARKPELYGIRIKPAKNEGFANYVLDYETVEGDHPTSENYAGLQAAMLSFAFGDGFNKEIQSWFRSEQMPSPTVQPDFVRTIANQPHPGQHKGEPRLCWLGGTPTWKRGLLTVSGERGDVVTMPTARSIASKLERCHPSNWIDGRPPKASELGMEWAEPFRRRGLVVV